MAKRHLFLIAFSLLVPFRSGLSHQLPPAGSSHAAVADAGEVASSSRCLVQGSDQALSPFAPKRRKLSCSTALPHHNLAKSLVRAEERLIGTQAATVQASEYAWQGPSYRKLPFGKECQEFKSIDQRIGQVMSTVQTLDFEHVRLPRQPLLGEVSLEVAKTSVYYRIIKGKTEDENKSTKGRESHNHQSRPHFEQAPEPSGAKQRAGAALLSWSDKAMALSQPHLNPPIQTLKNYVMFLVRGDGSLQLHGTFLQYLLNWNLPMRSSPGVGQSLAEERARNYFSGYYQHRRWTSLPSWSLSRPGALPAFAHALGQHVGSSRCKLLKLTSQFEEATAEIIGREINHRNAMGLSLRTQRSSQAVLSRENLITFCAVGYITTLYAVFTPFDRQTILEMREKLISLRADLKEAYLYLRLKEDARHVSCANTRIMSLITPLSEALQKTDKATSLVAQSISELISWWCNQQNPQKFSFLFGCGELLRVRSGFLGFLKDCLFVNWVES